MVENVKKLHIGRIVHYYWQSMRENRWRMIALFAFYTVGIVLVEIILPLVARSIIDMLSTLTPATAEPAALWRLFAIFVFVIVGHESAFRIADYMIVAFEARVVRRLTHFVTDRIMVHSAAFFGDRHSGSLIAQAKRFVSNFTNLFEIVVFHLWWSALKVPAVIITLAFIAPTVAVLFGVWMCAYIAVVAFFVRRGMPYDLAEAEADSAVTGRFSDMIMNVLTVKMFAQRDAERRAFARVTQQQYDAQKRAWRFEITQVLVQGLLFALLNVTAMYLSIVLWFAGEMSVGTVVIIQLYIAKLFGSLWPLGRVIKRFVKGLADAQEMADIFDTAVEVDDSAHPEPCRMRKGRITFDAVDFTYGDGQAHVLRNFSLTIPAGQKIGLVGSSGAGKSTVVKLLLRFADVTAGAISIDDQDVRAVTQDDLRSRIAYIPQEPLLFHRSIRENIAYARPDATDEEIVAAAQMAHAHDFIVALSQGYDTLVGERGIKLSGGQRQRIAFARAILKDAPILVMDEATSALDSVSEAHIQAATEDLMVGKTTIVIAHRLSTLKKMDRIIVMEAGRIVEDGAHDALLAHGGRYATFWAQQSHSLTDEEQA